jgi:prepilin-type N-terminal cleavage/methylation domain-containing protein
MKQAARVTSGEWRGTGDEPRVSCHPLPVTCHTKAAFTLIELMVVLGIMAIIMAMGIPSILRIWRKEGMRKATADVVEVCSKARAQAILSGSPMDVVFHPLERRLEIGGGSGGGGGSPPRTEGEGEFAVERRATPSSSDSSAQISEEIMIEMLDINLSEYKDSEWARVRFFPNGTSDEMTLVLRSDKNVWRKVSLEVTTGLASVDDVR